MLIFLIVLCDEFFHGDSAGIRYQLQVFLSLLVACHQFLVCRDSRLLVDNPLSKLVIVCIDTGSFFLLGWEVEGTRCHCTLDSRDSLELGRCTGSVDYVTLIL